MPPDELTSQPLPSAAEVRLALIEERLAVLQTSAVAMDKRLTDFADAMSRLTLVVETNAASRKGVVTVVVASISLLTAVAVAAIQVLGG